MKVTTNRLNVTENSLFNLQILLYSNPIEIQKYLYQLNVIKKYKQYLNILMLHQDLKDIPITYKLSTDYIWISFNESILKELYKPYKPIKDRIISIDMNPNYIGYSIVDWKDSETFKVIDNGVISIKHINDKFNQLKTTSSDSKKVYLNNKRLFETLQVSNFLIDKMKHYKCSIFAIEDLNIKSKDTDEGRRFNRLVNNQWNRNRLVNNLSKWCLKLI